EGHVGIEMLLEIAAAGIGDRPIIGPLSEDVTPVRLQSMALSGAAAVVESGADALVYVAGNGPEFAASLFAAAYAGVPLVPLNYRLGGAQLQDLLARHPDAFVVVDTEMVASDATIPDGAVPFNAWRDVLSGSPVANQLGHDDASPAVLIYTSGTTSAPKGVVLRHANLVSYVLGSTEFASAAETDAALMSVPPYHIAAIANVLTNLYSGRRLVSLERFSPDAWLTLVREECVTSAFVVPTMLSRIMASDDPPAIPSLRHLSYGGAPMPASVIRRALEVWPNVKFVNAYGLTETSSTVSLLGPEDHRLALSSPDPAVQARLSSVGTPLPGVVVEIRDDDGQPVGSGVVGRIHLTGAQVSGEYAGQKPLTDDRSFFDTRDLGYLDSDGYLFILGRSDDTIIRGAENIAPAEIEDVMIGHPSIEDVAVVGLPDEEWGQRIVAVAILDPRQAPVGSDELRQFVGSKLRSSKTPDEIEFWEQLPRTETGKLVRREVSARLLERESVDNT
ncbi:MAG: fatty acid--CoA ligase family protein, partial [Mycetocola sp.]